MSTDSKQLVQLLNGRWAGIIGSHACELHFGVVGLADPQFSGQIVIKKNAIYDDKSNQEHTIDKLDNINMFEQFGNGFISFTIKDGSNIVAMLSKKSLTLKGHRTVKAIAPHRHEYAPASKSEIHWHYIKRDVTYNTDAQVTVTEPFFAEKMN